VVKSIGIWCGGGDFLVKSVNSGGVDIVSGGEKLYLSPDQVSTARTHEIHGRARDDSDSAGRTGDLLSESKSVWPIE
jgi:hypothetical protein